RLPSNNFRSHRMMFALSPFLGIPGKPLLFPASSLSLPFRPAPPPHDTYSPTLPPPRWRVLLLRSASCIVPPALCIVPPIPLYAKAGRRWTPALYRPEDFRFPRNSCTLTNRIGFYFLLLPQCTAARFQSFRRTLRSNSIVPFHPSAGSSSHSIQSWSA